MEQVVDFLERSLLENGINASALDGRQRPALAPEPGAVPRLISREMESILVTWQAGTEVKE